MQADKLSWRSCMTVCMVHLSDTEEGCMPGRVDQAGKAVVALSCNDCPAQLSDASHFVQVCIIYDMVPPARWSFQLLIRAIMTFGYPQGLVTVKLAASAPIHTRTMTLMQPCTYFCHEKHSRHSDDVHMRWRANDQLNVMTSIVHHGENTAKYASL